MIPGYKKIAENGDWVLSKITECPDDNLDIQKAQSPLYMDKDIFNSCPYKEYIFQNHNVLFIIINGSYGLGITDEHSDYDLEVFIKGEAEELERDVCLFYKGRKVHWYYQDKNYKPLSIMELIGVAEYCKLSDKQLIYATDEGRGLFNKLKQISPELSKTAMELIVAYQKDNTFQWYINQPINEESKFIGKFAGAYSLIYFYLFDKVDEMDTAEQLYLKRIRWCPLQSLAIEHLKERLKSLIALPLPSYEQLEQKIYSEYESIWEEN